MKASLGLGSLAKADALGAVAGFFSFGVHCTLGGPATWGIGATYVLSMGVAGSVIACIDSIW